jgi:hypothetical protein
LELKFGKEVTSYLSSLLSLGYITRTEEIKAPTNQKTIKLVHLLLPEDDVLSYIALAKSRHAIGGRYILTPKIFEYLDNQLKGNTNEIELTDAILRLMDEEDVYGYQIDGRRYDIGSRYGYIEAIIDFALNREELHDDVVKLIKNKAEQL